MSIRLICFAGELNNLELMGMDISIAYLEAYTGDPLVFTAGPEFSELEGHTMVVVKALYGIPGSGKQWAERFAAILRQEGWVPCHADHDVWMKAHNPKSHQLSNQPLINWLLMLQGGSFLSSFSTYT